MDANFDFTVEHTSDDRGNPRPGIYRLIIFERDDEGSRCVYNIIEADGRYIAEKVLELLCPDEPLKVRKVQHAKHASK